jgi:2'-5' RNA ligase
MSTRIIGVAIAIPPPWDTQLIEARRLAGDPEANLVPPHITLLPPTEVPVEADEEITRHLHSVAQNHAPFSLHLRGTGTFRPITNVVFIAVANGISQCELLQQSVRSGPLHRDIPFPYHPHVTVAHDVSTMDMDNAYQQYAQFEAQFQVDSFTMYEHSGAWRPILNCLLAT